MNESYIGNNLIRRRRIKKSINYFFGLSGKNFLAAEYINGNDKTDDKIPHGLKKADDAGR